MNGDDLDKLKRREEQKRDAQWDAAERWRLWQEMIPVGHRGLRQEHFGEDGIFVRRWAL